MIECSVEEFIAELKAAKVTKNFQELDNDEQDCLTFGALWNELKIAEAHFSYTKYVLYQRFVPSNWGFADAYDLEQGLEGDLDDIYVYTVGDDGEREFLDNDEIEELFEEHTDLMCLCEPRDVLGDDQYETIDHDPNSECETFTLFRGSMRTDGPLPPLRFSGEVIGYVASSGFEEDLPCIVMGPNFRGKDESRQPYMKIFDGTALTLYRTIGGKYIFEMEVHNGWAFDRDTFVCETVDESMAFFDELQDRGSWNADMQHLVNKLYRKVGLRRRQCAAAE